MKTGKNGKGGKDRQGNHGGFWPAVIDIARSYAAYRSGHLQKPDDPLAHRIGHFTRVTAYGTCAGAFLAGVAALIFWFQLRATYDQLAELQAEQRPWIAIQSVKVDRPLEFADDAARLYTTLTIKNVGHTPAIGVAIAGAFLIRDIDPTSALKRIAEECAKMQTKDRIQGFVAFPDQIIPMPGWYDLLPADTKHLQDSLATPGNAAFILGGCVDYMFNVNGEHHQTGFVYEIDRAGPNGEPQIIDPRNGTLQPNQILIENNPTLTGKIN